MVTKGRTLYLDLSKLPEPVERFTFHEIIGEGHFAQVYRATDTENGNRTVAIKILENLPEIMLEAEEEYRILKDLSHHPNFCEFYGAFVKRCGAPEKDQLWFVMEYCSGGSIASLASALRSKEKKLPESIIAFVLKEVINGLSHLHRNHIMHRNIKGSSILINQEGSIKIVDFGFAKHLKHTLSKRSTSIGSPYWMAPEIINSHQNQSDGYDNHCDVWSLGITAIEIGDGEPPLSNVHPVRALFQIVKNPPPTLKKTSEWTSTYSDFITECLIKNPEYRPVVMELGEHPFIQEVPENTAKVIEDLVKLVNEAAEDAKSKKSCELVVKNGCVKEERNNSHEVISFENLTSFQDLDHDKLIQHLERRFQQGKYHTYAGDVLVVLNPHRETDNYNDNVHDRYKSKTLSDEEPHIFAMADKALQDMLHHKEHQNIILAGYRNSGKTFNFNKIIQHLCHIAHGNEAMAKRIASLPFILDAFGNAATNVNKNSTRHVRYVELTFTESGKISGAVVALYLLEKWRVTNCLNGNDRNFHIFYYVYYGLRKSGSLAKYYLGGRENLKFLPGEETELSGECATGYDKFVELLHAWELDEDENEFVYKTVAAILLLGEVEFTGEGAAEVFNKDVVANVATLLDFDIDKLLNALLVYEDFSKGSTDTKTYTVFEADAACCSLARGLYSRLVDWLINTLNVKLCAGRIIFGDYNSLAVIDMFGFEDRLDGNSLEQFLANLTNEQFLYHYNQHVFAWEMQDYSSEGIEMQNFDFRDNRPLLDMMLSKPEGVLAFLDDECRSAGKGTNFLDALSGFLRNDYLQVNTVKSSFAVKHLGGWVNYDIGRFVEKNRDYLAPELTAVMRSSANPFLSSLFSNQMTKTGHVTVEVVPNEKLKKRESSSNSTKKFNTVSKGRYSQTRQMQTLSMQLRHSFIELLQKLVKGTPHFVRCINSNRDGQAEFDRSYVEDQILAFGVTETVRIRQLGYPYRLPFDEFLRRYKFLAFDFDETVELTPDNCRLLLIRLRMEGWILGKTKILLRYSNQEYLSRLSETHVKKIVKVQSVIRTILARKLNRLRNKDGCKWRKSANISPEEAAAIAIQKNFRGFQARKEASAIAQRKKFQSATVEDEAAHIIQYFWRKWKTKTLFQQLLLYRAEKQQQLIYFCQQVHLYNQEICGCLRHSSEAVNPLQIVPKSRSQTPLPAAPKVKKIPLNLKNRHFLNTTFMCATSFIKAANETKTEKEENEWDTPIRQSSSPVAKQPAADENRKPSSSLSPRSPESKSPKPGSLPLKKTPISSACPSPSPKSPSPVPSAAALRATSSSPRVTFKVGEWQSSSALSRKTTTEPEVESPVSTSSRFSIAQEMQTRAATAQQPAEDAPFNFQGMLRKTNYCRESMRRSRKKPNTGDPQADQKTIPPVLERRKNASGSSETGSSGSYSSITSKQSHNSSGEDSTGVDSGSITSPSKHEIAPGLVIEGEEVDL